MRVVALASIFCVAFVCQIGCSKDKTGQQAAANSTGDKNSTGKQVAGGIAVVDLDEVAKRLGRGDEINQAIIEKQNKLNQQLVQLEKKYKAEYKQLEELYGDNPSEEEATKIKDTDRELGTQLTEVRRSAQNEIIIFRKSLVDRFREEVRPVARRIAKARGLTVVVSRDNRTMLSVEASSDITDEVVEILSSGGSRKTSAVSRPDSSKISRNDSRGGSYKQ